MEYFYERGMNRFRVWHKHWPNDRFEVLTAAQFAKLQEVSAEFPDLIGPLVECQCED